MSIQQLCRRCATQVTCNRFGYMHFRTSPAFIMYLAASDNMRQSWDRSIDISWIESSTAWQIVSWLNLPVIGLQSKRKVDSGFSNVPTRMLRYLTPFISLSSTTIKIFFVVTVSMILLFSFSAKDGTWFRAALSDGASCPSFLKRFLISGCFNFCSGMSAHKKARATAEDKFSLPSIKVWFVDELVF